jgi:phage-related protein
MTIKPVEFLGDTIEVLRAFPDNARRDAGFQLDKVQRGEEPDDWKPMSIIGAGCKEIRIRDKAGAFRVIFLAMLVDAVYVLHCFQKKTQETGRKDIKLARSRFKELMRKQP